MVLPAGARVRMHASRLALAVPAYRGQIQVQHLEQLHNLIGACAYSQVQAGQQKHTDRMLVGQKPVFQFAGIIHIVSCSIAKARNLMLFGALKSNAIDWLLMCDADNYFEGDSRAILRMLADAQRKDAAVVVAPILRRDGNYHVLVDEDEQGLVCVDANQRQYDRKCRSLTPADFRGKMLPVTRAGSGFMALHVPWFRAHWPVTPWFQFAQAPREDGQPHEIGEDHVFCDGVRQRGGLILCDGRLEPYHEGAPYHLVQGAAATPTVAEVVNDAAPPVEAHGQ